MLGGVDLRGPHGSEVRELVVGPKRVALLSYLILRSPRGFQRRDTLLGLLWPELDQDHARSSLRNMLYVMRRWLGEGVLVSRGDEELAIDSARLWCDAAAFDVELKQGNPEEALTLYRGELLPGFFVSGAVDFDRWLEDERRELKDKASSAAWSLANRFMTAGNMARAKHWAGRALAISPYDEDALRRLIAVFEQNGDCAGAIALYEDFRSRLATDLDLAPSDETQAIVERLRARLKPSRTSGPREDHERRSTSAKQGSAKQGSALGPSVSLAAAEEEDRISLPQPCLPYNIPTQPTALLGREEELERIRAILLGSKTRMLTLTGAPGTGKTRLALQLANEMAGHFRNGVAAVFLASVTKTERVAFAMAHALGLRERGSGPVIDRLQEYLRPLHALVVLDNFEQVLGASSVVSQLLAGCPDLMLVVTSRAALRVRGERELVVPPLKVPGAQHLSEVEHLSTYAAVQLFVERAQAVRASFAIGERNAAAVVDICRRLDGLPLAIELAAARVRMFPPAVIVDRLKDRIDFLTEGPRDLPAHQQTIRSTIDWSYNLLSRAEQRLFRHLGVFVGGFTFVAAEDIAGEVSDLTEKLSSLIDKSLVTRVDREDGEPRYSMLEMLREYAYQHLVSEGEAEDAQRRYAEFYTAFAERADPALKGREQAAWLERLESEHDNLRAVLTWAAGHDSHLTARIACGLSRFWSARGHFTEGREWLERVVQNVDAIPPALQVRALNSAGVLANCQAEYARAIELWERALALGRLVGDEHEVSRSLTNLAGAYVQLGEVEQATNLLEQALATCGDDKRVRASILGNLGYVEYVQGKRQSERVLWEECLQLNREIGDTNNTVVALNNLAYSYLSEGEAEKAEQFVEEALRLSEQLGTSTAACILVENMAWLAQIRGQDERAVSLNKEALEMARRSGGARQFLSIIQSLGELSQKEHRPGRAARLYAISSSIAEQRGFLGSTLLERRKSEANISALRSSMGEAAFEEAWAEGAAMSLDEALAFALS